MTNKRCLGIHYCSAGITATLVEKRGLHSRLIDVFKVPATPADAAHADRSPISQLARLLAQRYPKIPPVALALSGRFIRNQDHHSEFTDTRLIRQTLRYDVEEDFAADADDLVLSFQQIRKDDTGSQLLIFSHDRPALRDLLDKLEKARLDALVAEPDIAAWIHYIRDLSDIPAQKGLLALAWTAGVLYILVLDPKGKTVLARTCLCQDLALLADILIVELHRTLALLEDSRRPGCLIYHSANLSPELLNRLPNEFHLPCQPLQEPDVAVAFAGGAALGYLQHKTGADMRADGLSPQSITTARHHALFGLSAAVSLFFVCLALLMRFSARQNHTLIDQANQTITQAWRDTHKNEATPSSLSTINNLLKKQQETLVEQTRRQANVSQTNSASNTLLMLLQTINTLPEVFNMQIEQLQVSETEVIMKVLIPSWESEEKIHQAFRNHLAWAALPPFDSVLTADGRRLNITVPLKKK